MQNFPKNLVLADQLATIAKRKGVTPSALTLAWLLAQGDDIFPIPGTTNLDRLEENLNAMHIKLSKEEEQEIRQACENATTHGERYPEAMMHTCFADSPALSY